MFSSPIVQIIEVIDKLTQGLSEPYLCKSESNSEYIVKGLRSGRRSQIPEWVCANLAKILGLPIADFSLVEVPQLLYEELPISLSGIGSGIAFGSEKAHEASWFEGMQTHHIPKDLRQKVLIFDLWVKNMDRTPSNPNLLYRAKSAELIVIDHNLAFDKDFTLSDFLQTHIFSDCFTEIASDLVSRSELEAWLQTAFASLEEICDNLPLEWEWLNMECDLPTNYDFEFMLRCLERCTIPGKLWEDV